MFVPCLHGGLIFIRYVYIRYADELIIEGQKILNYIVLCFVFLFGLIFFIIWPVLDNLKRGNDFPLNHHKGRVCTMLPLNFSDPATRREHQKPKIMICTLGKTLYLYFAKNILFFGIAAIWIFYVVWMLLFSLRQVKKYKILSFRRNLLTMKEHTFISCCLLFYCGSDQMLMKIIESIHESTSVKDVFKLWWTTHLIEKILVFPFKNVLILVSARNFPEFHGYFGQIFPEQEKPKWPLPSFPG